MKTGVYVGSFNPVHKWHIKIVNHLINNGYLDKIIIVPTGNYWDKNDLISIKDRINMLKIFENDSVIINTSLNDLTFTYEIFEALTNSIDDDFSLIMGADNIVNFDKWKNFEYLRRFNIVIINRNNVDVSFYLNKHGINNYTLVDDLEEINVSSTMIRRLINEENHAELKYYVDEEVLEYIKENKLYLCK